MTLNFIEFSIKYNTGIIKLNRPKALNALDYNMASDFLNIIIKWKKNKKISRVLLYGEGKAFCAGGDVKSLILSSNKESLKEIFFSKRIFIK